MAVWVDRGLCCSATFGTTCASGEGAWQGLGVEQLVAEVMAAGQHIVSWPGGKEELLPAPGDGAGAWDVVV